MPEGTQETQTAGRRGLYVALAVGVFNMLPSPITGFATDVRRHVTPGSSRVSATISSLSSTTVDRLKQISKLRNGYGELGVSEGRLKELYADQSW